MREFSLNQVGSTVLNMTADPDAIYARRLMRHILQLLSLGPLTFCEVIRLADGAYPTKVQRVLHSLVTAEEVNEINGGYFLPGRIEQQPMDIETTRRKWADMPKVEQSSVPSRSASSAFADPHPADYDWRYASASLVELSRRLSPLIERGAKIALSGATSLFPQLIGAGAHVMHFDRRASLLKDLESMGFKEGLIEHDLFNPIPNVKCEYDVVVADPPWYPDFHKAFMLRSTELLWEEGLLLLSVLPWLTRPSAIEDRADILRFAMQLGFDLIEAAPGVLTYESPKFERVALAMKGIHCNEWRAGDLFVFRRVNEPTPGLAATRPTDEPEWDEYRFGRRKVKLRRRPEADGTRFGLRPAAENSPIFGSVSRRSPFRSRVDLWTLDNQAYSVGGLELLRHALKRLESGEPPGTIAQDLALTHALSYEETHALMNLLGELADENGS